MRRAATSHTRRKQSRASHTHTHGSNECHANTQAQCEATSRRREQPCKRQQPREPSKLTSQAAPRMARTATIHASTGVFINGELSNQCAPCSSGSRQRMRMRVRRQQTVQPTRLRHTHDSSGRSLTRVACRNVGQAASHTLREQPTATPSQALRRQRGEQPGSSMRSASRHLVRQQRKRARSTSEAGSYTARAAQAAVSLTWRHAHTHTHTHAHTRARTREYECKHEHAEASNKLLTEGASGHASQARQAKQPGSTTHARTATVRANAGQAASSAARRPVLEQPRAMLAQARAQAAYSAAAAPHTWL